MNSKNLLIKICISILPILLIPDFCFLGFVFYIFVHVLCLRLKYDWVPGFTDQILHKNILFGLDTAIMSGILAILIFIIIMIDQFYLDTTEWNKLIAKYRNVFYGKSTIKKKQFIENIEYASRTLLEVVSIFCISLIVIVTFTYNFFQGEEDSFNELCESTDSMIKMAVKYENKSKVVKTKEGINIQTYQDRCETIKSVAKIFLQE